MEYLCILTTKLYNSDSLQNNYTHLKVGFGEKIGQFEPNRTFYEP